MVKPVLLIGDLNDATESGREGSLWADTPIALICAQIAARVMINICLILFFACTLVRLLQIRKGVCK